jgi:hypothetical protein
MIDREKARRLHEELMDLNDQELGINTDDARKHNHEEAAAVRTAMEEANGTLPRDRRRIVSTAAGQPAHRPATAKLLDAIFGSGKNPNRKTEQRYAVARILLDRLPPLLGRPESREAARLILADMGYSVPSTAGDEQPMGIRRPTRRQGVIIEGGAAAAGRMSLYNALGYTLGAEGKRDCSPAVWRQRAALHLRSKVQPRRPGPKSRGPSAPVVSLETAEKVVAAAWPEIEDETKDRDLDHDPNARGDFSPRLLFRNGWRQGDADRRNNCVQKSLKLQKK